MVQVVGVVASKVTGWLLRQHGIDGGGPLVGCRLKFSIFVGCL